MFSRIPNETKDFTKVKISLIMVKIGWKSGLCLEKVPKDEIQSRKDLFIDWSALI